MIETVRFPPIIPVRLRAAVERAIVLHPGTARVPATLPASELAELRKRVAAAQYSAERLGQLALELNPREVRSLVTGIEQWEDLRAATGTLLWARMKSGLLRPLWNAWQRHPHLPELRDVLLAAGKRFDWLEVAGSYAPAVPGWVTAMEPGHAIRPWLEELGLSYSDIGDLSGSPFTPDTPLLKLVRNAVMTHGSSSQLRVEGPQRLHAWTPELRPEEQLLFRRNYLLRIPAKEWHRSVVDGIEQHYGIPRRPRLPRFWDEIPEPIQAAFQQLFIRKWIHELFRNDVDRRDYWERWAKRMDYVQRDTVKGTEYGVFDFGTFGVVEFFEHGNAAFFYPPHLLGRVRKRHVSEPGSLKEEWYPPFDYPRSNRLIHNPSPRGWYDRADSMVRTWLRSTVS